MCSCSIVSPARKKSALRAQILRRRALLRWLMQRSQKLSVLSGLSLVWVLFLAPVWCGAVTRKHGPCRNNSWGLLLGCHLREHRWQKFKMMFVNRRWQQLNRGLWSSPAEVLATVSGLITIVGVVVAIVRIALGTPVV